MLTDDHILVRKGIRCLLEADRWIKVVCEAEDGEECIDLLGKGDIKYLIFSSWT